jgi:hypothetical protein
MTGFDSKRKMAQAKVRDDDDTQVYADTLTIVYQRGFSDGKKAANAMHDLARLGQELEQEPCIGKDPRCPCQDGGACHYKDCVGTKARPVAQPEQEPVAEIIVKNGHWIETTGFADQTLPDGLHKLYTTPPATPSEWPLIKNILAEYGLDAIAFVAEWKAAQRKWQGLTEEEVSELSLPRRYLVREVEAKLKERNI